MITFSRLGKYGRLGNQFFQIASTIGIAIKNEQEFGFPLWDYQNYFKNPLPVEFIQGARHYKEPDYRYHDVALNGANDWDLEGYFQSWKYFDHCKQAIKYYFEFDRVRVAYDRVAVHIRRGDYVNLQHVHPLLSKEYYDLAFQQFPDCQFTVFSDDIEWCKKNILHKDIIYHNTDVDICDFQLMSSFTKFIIANSSFSFWAAYLSSIHNVDTVVIAPKNYVIGEDVDDRLLPEWIKL